MPVQETRLTMSNIHRIDRHRINHAPVAQRKNARTLPPPVPLWPGRGGMQTNAVFRTHAYLAFNGASALMRIPMTIMLNQNPKCPKGTRWMIKKQRQGCQKRNGIWHGRHTAWHPNGKKRAVGKYVNGKKHGLWKEWYSNGKKRAVGKYVNGKARELFQFWHPNGKKRAVGKYVNGKTHGAWKEWHPNGKKSAAGTYVNGKARGLWKYWHTNGKKESEGKFVNGKKHGLFKFWHTNGNKSAEGKYVNGKLHGLWKFWNSNGKMVAEERYVNGVIVKDSWISKELKQVYGAKRWKAGKGVDLNGNGKLEKNEKIATHNTNTIPGNDKHVIGGWTDWLAFYRANYRVIHAKTARSKSSIFFWAAKFKTTNPLHIITSIESPMVKHSQVLTAYKKTWKIIARARKIPVKGRTKLNLAKSKVLAVYTAMVKSGIKFKEQYKELLFVENMVRGVLDCDTSNFVILTESHEKGWPLSLVNAPNHYFVRWGDKRTRVRFNMDSTYKKRFLTDSEYTKILNISSRAISTGVYLKNFKLSALVSTVIANRGQSYNALGKTQEAIKDYTKAIKLNPKFVLAYNNRGNVYGNLGKYTRAIIDFTKAIKLEPKDAIVYYNRGIIYGKLGKYKHAIKDFTKAIKVDRKFATAYFYRGILYLLKKQYTLAIGDYKKLLSLIQKSHPIYTQVRDNLEKAYLNRGIKRVKARKFAGAVSDFREILKLNPKNSLASLLIKKHKPCIRNPRKCP